MNCIVVQISNVTDSLNHKCRIVLMERLKCPNAQYNVMHLQVARLFRRL